MHEESKKIQATAKHGKSMICEGEAKLRTEKQRNGDE